MVQNVVFLMKWGVKQRCIAVRKKKEALNDVVFVSQKKKIEAKQ